MAQYFNVKALKTIFANCCRTDLTTYVFNTSKANIYSTFFCFADADAKLLCSADYQC